MSSDEALAAPVPMADGEVGEAPGDLRLIEEFVNSVELPDGEDLLATVEGIRLWLIAHGVDASPVAEPERTALVELREGLRDVLEGNAGNRVPPDAIHLVTQRLHGSRLAVVITESGAHAHPAPEHKGVDAFLGQLAAAMLTASIDGTWQRLKVCRNHKCRWAFYDRSKNGGRTWCSMRVCGCRSKARTYRARKRAASVDARG